MDTTVSGIISNLFNSETHRRYLFSSLTCYIHIVLNFQHTYFSIDAWTCIASEWVYVSVHAYVHLEYVFPLLPFIASACLLICVHFLSRYGQGVFIYVAFLFKLASVLVLCYICLCIWV